MGSNSKKSGERTTIDQNGTVIGNYMKLKKIYIDVLNLFPEIILINDGETIEETNGFTSPNLIAAYDVAEYTASKKGEWQELMVWMIYQILHENAKYLFEQKVYELNRNIDFSRFKSLLINNLKLEGYEDMYKEFIRSKFFMLEEINPN